MTFSWRRQQEERLCLAAGQHGHHLQFEPRRHDAVFADIRPVAGDLARWAISDGRPYRDSNNPIKIQRIGRKTLRESKEIGGAEKHGRSLAQALTDGFTSNVWALSTTTGGIVAAPEITPE